MNDSQLQSRALKKLNIIKSSDATLEKIRNKYKSGKSHTTAKKALTFCEEWAIINVDEISGMSEEEAKSDCRKYVRSKLSEGVGNPIVTFLVSLLIKMIVNWIIDEFFSKLTIVNK